MVLGKVRSLELEKFQLTVLGTVRSLELEKFQVLVLGTGQMGRMDPIRWLQDLHADVGELLPPEGSP
jgi:hypothetical protein